MLQSDLQAERFTGRKISNLWVKEMFVFFGKKTDYSFNDTESRYGLSLWLWAKEREIRRLEADMADLLWF